MFGRRDRVSVSIATSDDLDAILRLDEMAGRAWGRDRLRRFMKVPGQVVLVAALSGRDQAQVAGFATGHLGLARAYLGRIVVGPPLRRRGVATALLAALERRLVGERDACYVSVPESRLDAQCFLRSRGYRCWAIMRGMLDKPSESYYEFEKFRPGSPSRDQPFRVIARDGSTVRSYPVAGSPIHVPAR